MRRKKIQLNRRILCQLCIEYALGTAFWLKKECLFLVPAFIVPSLMLAEFIWKGRRRDGFLRAFLFSLFFIMGICLAHMSQSRYMKIQSLFPEEETILGQGRIYKEQEKNDKVMLFLEESVICTEFKSSKKYSLDHILVFIPNEKYYPIGKTITIKGKLVPFETARNAFNYDEKKYYMAQNIDFKVIDATVTGVYGKRSVFSEIMYGLANKLENVYFNCMNKRQAGTLSVMVLGDKSLLDTEVKQIYQKVGISHLLCVSGLHLSIVGMSIYHLLRKRGGSYLLAGIVAGTMVFAFSTMCGSGVSARRALYMFFLLLTSKWIGRTYDAVTSLAATFFAMILKNPLLIMDAGLLLSFGAVFGVAVCGKTIVKCFEPKSQWIQSICMSAGIQWMTIPLVCAFFYEIPVYSLLINLILLPLMGVVLVLGIIGGFIGMTSITVGRCLLFVPQLILIFYEKMADVFADLPYANYISGSPKMEHIFLYYSVLALGVVLMESYMKKGSLMLPFCLCLLLWPKRQIMEVDILDVGQGDGIYICSREGVSMFIDGGSTDVRSVGAYRILPFLKGKGVKKIAYWFISHTDEDHVSGMKEIVESGYEIENVVLGKYGYQDDSMQEFINYLKKNKINIIFLDSDSELVLEQSKMKCLFPDSTYVVKDANAGSMVLWYSAGKFSGIFTGDISSVEEKYLLEKNDIGEVDLYKAAHHGSDQSNSCEFIKELSPRISTISCGENNRYGHPGENAMSHMKEQGQDVYLTMEAGQISIIPGDDAIFVQKNTNPLEVITYPMLQ